MSGERAVDAGCNGRGSASRESQVAAGAGTLSGGSGLSRISRGGLEVAGSRSRGCRSSGLRHCSTRVRNTRTPHLPHVYSRSLRTRDSPVDLNATPFRTTSRFSPVSLMGAGRWYGAGRGGTWVERDAGL